MPYTEPSPRHGFLRRLSYYLSGIAIGCMVLGFFHMTKKHQAKLEAERQAQIQSQPPPKDDLFPPIPKSDQPQPESPPTSAVAAPNPLAK